jgi:hypothetical protein
MLETNPTESLDMLEMQETYPHQRGVLQDKICTNKENRQKEELEMCELPETEEKARNEEEM